MKCLHYWQVNVVTLVRRQQVRGQMYTCSFMEALWAFSVKYPHLRTVGSRTHMNDTNCVV